MKDNARRVTVYLNEENCDYLEEKKEKKGISYSDIVNAAIENGKPVDKETFETFMDTGDLLPVDLMVRTSNENRISNFLLWKLAYAELLFIPEHWPDLVKSEKLWQHILEEYQKRDRRFGGGKKKNYLGKTK